MTDGHEDRKKEYKLVVNKKDKTWPDRHIKGSDILHLAESPPDWIVNQLVTGPGQDPEISNDEKVDLDEHSEPKGIKRFQTRKPSTSPGQ